MYYTVYKITNRINDHIYIGVHQTSNLDDGYMGSGKNINNAIKKYGMNKFNKDFLGVFTNKESAYLMEAALVNESFIKHNSTYNMKCGGFGGWPKNAAKSYVEKRKANPKLDRIFKEMCRNNGKAIQLRRKTDPEFDATFREQCRLAFKGRTHTEESKLKISYALKGNCYGSKNSQYGTMWVTDGIESKKIKKDEAMPEGWHKGRII